jgi:hypothetical protein
MNEHVPATAIPLEVVRSRIENILKIQRGHKQTLAAALDVKTKIEAGQSVDNLKIEGVKVEDIAALHRKDSARVSDAAILHNAFDMAPPQNGKAAVREVNLISGDVALVVLKAVNLPENILQSELDMVKSKAIRENAIRDFSSALLVIKESADIDRNMNLVNKVD